MATFDSYFIIFTHLSDWLLFNTKWAVFQLCHGDIKLDFNEMMMMSTLY